MSEIRWIALAIAPLLSGCLFMGGGRKTIFDETNRLEARFATTAASRMFEEGMAAADRSIYTDGGGFVILFIAGGGGEIFHETPFYNSQVRRADANRDGEITEEEAASYRDAARAEST